MGEGDSRLQTREEEAKGGGGGPLRRAGEEEPARRPDTSHSLRAHGLQLPACSAAALRGLHLPTAPPWGRTLLGHRQWNEAGRLPETFVNSKNAWEGSRIFLQPHRHEAKVSMSPTYTSTRFRQRDYTSQHASHSGPASPSEPLSDRVLQFPGVQSLLNAGTCSSQSFLHVKKK